MSIRFRCPSCQQVCRAGEEAAGKLRSCPRCGGTVQVPQKEPVEITMDMLEPATNPWREITPAPVVASNPWREITAGDDASTTYATRVSQKVPPPETPAEKRRRVRQRALRRTFQQLGAGFLTTFGFILSFLVIWAWLSLPANTPTFVMAIFLVILPVAFAFLWRINR